MNTELITAHLRQMDAETTCNSRGEAWAFANGESVFSCTAGARHVAQVFDGVVVGYWRDDNPAAEFPCDDGHDFAIIADRFVVDYWAGCIAGALDRAVFDLHDPVDRATVLRLYGQPAAWKLLDFQQPKRNS